MFSAAFVDALPSPTTKLPVNLQHEAMLAFYAISANGSLSKAILEPFPRVKRAGEELYLTVETKDKREYVLTYSPEFQGILVVVEGRHIHISGYSDAADALSMLRRELPELVNFDLLKGNTKSIQEYMSRVSARFFKTMYLAGHVLESELAVGAGESFNFRAMSVNGKYGWDILITPEGDFRIGALTPETPKWLFYGVRERKMFSDDEHIVNFLFDIYCMGVDMAICSPITLVGAAV
jgi:hypothetical protein